MKTKVRDAKDAMEMLAENLEMVLNGERDVSKGTFVQKNVSGMIQLAKAQILEKMRVNDTVPLGWFLVDEDPKKLKFGKDTKEDNPVEFSKPDELMNSK